MSKCHTYIRKKQRKFTECNGSFKKFKSHNHQLQLSKRTTHNQKTKSRKKVVVVVVVFTKGMDHTSNAQKINESTISSI